MTSKSSAPISSIQKGNVSVHDLIAITPLGQHTPRTDNHAGITMAEIVDSGLVSVTARLGHEKAAVDLVASITGQKAPAPAQATKGAFWIGPDQWMIEVPLAGDDDPARDIVAKAKDIASITDQSEAWCRFDLTGDRLADVFERLCNADLRRFEGGEAVRTSIEHLGCFLICRTPQHVSVLGPRSSAGSLHHAILTAMRSAL
jgi:sarcosine oxidase subunit gamma